VKVTMTFTKLFFPVVTPVLENQVEEVRSAVAFAKQLRDAVGACSICGVYPFRFIDEDIEFLFPDPEEPGANNSSV